MQRLDAIRQSIQQTLAPLLGKYHQLAERERLAVSALGAVLLLCLVYWLMWAPLQAKHAEAKSSYASQQRVLAWMKEHQTVISKARSQSNNSRANKDSHKDVLSITNSTANKHSVQMRSFSPNGANKLTFQLEQQTFISVMEWLFELENSYGIEVVSIDISSTATPGKVNVRASLERKS